MKKTLLIIILAPILVLSGCGGSKNLAPSVQVPDDIPENGDWRPDQGLVCSYLCERKIPEMCADDIGEMQAQGTDLNGSIMDYMSCQLMCEADWSQDTIACVSDADLCAQLSSDAPYCQDDSAEPDDSALYAPLPGNCVQACQNYTYCAAYGDDITPADLDDAFVSCLEFCAGWDAQTRNCVAQTPIRRPNDCAAQTACVLKEVREMMNR